MSASETWVAQREDLAVEALRRTGRLRLQVRGESMLPALWPGDVAEIADCSLNDLRHGEVVLASQEGRFYLHRFLSRRDPDGFLTRGDSMPHPDPVFPAEALLGRLVGISRAAKTASAPMPLRPWSRALGFVFCFCSPVRRLALKLHRRRTTARADKLHAGNLTSDLGSPQI